MPNLNKIMLMGNLTRDPEVRYTPKGTAVATIGLAINRRWTTEAGEQKEEVTFIEADAWGKQAETIGQYLSKGKPLFIEGRLKTDQWDDKETGQKRSKLKVVIESFQFIGGKTDGEQERGPAQTSGGRRAPTPQREFAEGNDDDNIPFRARFRTPTRIHSHH